MKGDPGAAIWIIGPQLIGSVILITGWIFKTWPPKKINNWYGYRTATAMKNQEIWDEANRYSARLMMKLGAIFIVIGFAISALMSALPLNKQTIAVLIVLPCIASGMCSGIITMVMTEKHLAKTFDEKQE